MPKLSNPRHKPSKRPCKKQIPPLPTHRKNPPLLDDAFGTMEVSSSEQETTQVPSTLAGPVDTPQAGDGWFGDKGGDGNWGSSDDGIAPYGDL